MLKIGFVSAIVNNKNVYKVETIKALKASELPDEYLNGAPNVYTTETGNDLIVTIRPGIRSKLTKGAAYEPDEMLAMLEVVEKAGDRLKRIRDKMQRGGWEGNRLVFRT